MFIFKDFVCSFVCNNEVEEIQKQMLKCKCLNEKIFRNVAVAVQRESDKY